MKSTVDSRKYLACIMGASLDVGNMGVRALGTSLAGLILRNHPDAEICFMYGNRLGGERLFHLGDEQVHVKVINCRMSPRAKLAEHILWILLLAVLYRCLPFRVIRRGICRANPWIDALAEADFIGDIRGGDSFSDIYGISRFLSGSLPCLSAILMGRKLELLPQTYGPFHSTAGKWLAGFIFRNATSIHSRDYASIKTALDLMGSPAKHLPEFCPEIAFTLPSSRPAHVDIDDYRQWKNTSTLVGINISGLLYIGGYTRNNMFGLGGNYPELIDGLLRALLQKTEANLLIVPHVFDDSEENDIAACRQVYKPISEEYPDRVRWIDTYCNQSEIKSIIGLCDFFIGSRMHACIAALSQCIPSVGLAYSGKFSGVFGSLGLEDMVLDARALQKEDLISACLSRFSERETVRAMLRERVPPLQVQVNEVFHRILSSKSNEMPVRVAAAAAAPAR